MLLGAWLGSVYVFELDTNEGTELGYPDGKVLSTTLGAMRFIEFLNIKLTYLCHKLFRKEED